MMNNRRKMLTYFCFLLFVNNKSQNKFQTDRSWANSVDPDQTAPEEQSDQGLHCLQFPLHLLDASFGCITLRKPHLCSTFRAITIIFRVSEIL